MEKVSVIVPIYKVEKYLRDCLESIINQSYRDLEIILIDDGSPDNSGGIADEYAGKDSRIKVIHKQNGGVAGARNDGLRMATGKYVTFVDSDDILHLRQYEILHSLIWQTGADIATCEKQDFVDGTLVDLKTECEMRGSEISKDDAIVQMVCNKDVGNYFMLRMYKIELFDGIQFPEGKVYEDVATLYKLVDRAKKIAYTDQKLYFYRVAREGAITSNFTKKKLQDSLEAYYAQYSFLKEKYKDVKDYICLAYVKSYTSAMEKMMINGYHDMYDQEYVLNRYGDFKEAFDNTSEQVLMDNLEPYRLNSSAILYRSRGLYEGLFDSIYELKNKN